MELKERDHFLALLQTELENIETEGHCIFVSGEAGIGKTSLIKTFCKQQKANCIIYQGACDALFTPRPLAPLYDVMWQMKSSQWPGSNGVEDRSALFAAFYREVYNKKEKTLIVFEDIHWADEATLDFIKFFARRITLLPCLFILTYRDDEIYGGHPLKNVLGHLPPDACTSLKLTALTRETVDKMAAEKGYNGKDVYNISGGNPFYVNEILASYSLGVPDNIVNAILSTYNRGEEKTRQIWDLLSVIPAGFEITYLEKLEPQYAAAIEKCVEKKLLIINDGQINFKHELYRRAIEASLSPLKKVLLNKNILDLFRASFEENQQIERIIHHAKNANAYDVVVHYAPLAAKKAAALGAHIQAAKLYLSAIEYYQGNDEEILIGFYDGYAYECYLTNNNTREAIVYAGKSLDLWKKKNDTEKTGNCLRFLSRLWWFDGNRKNAEYFAEQAIETLQNQPSSSSKAMAFSNMSQLKMLSDQNAECISWGEKAIAIAKELGDEETLCHALNNVGSVQMKIPASSRLGVELLQQSLAIALKNSYHDHVARAYTNIAGTSCTMKNYLFTAKILDEGISYCEERDLDAYTSYLLSWKARLNVETGCWQQAYTIAESLLKNESQSFTVKIVTLPVVAKIKMRRGQPDAVSLLLEAKTMAFETRELQRILPVMTGLLEYEWVTGQNFIEPEAIDSTINMINGRDNFCNNEFAFWLFRARKQQLSGCKIYEGYDTGNTAKALKAAAFWKKTGNPYMEALTLFEGNDADKRKALTIIQGLGADAVFEKMKLEMRTSGIKNIPKGIRKTTRSNAALLTTRELDLLPLLKEGLQNKEIASRLFISAKTVDHHISSILFKLDVNSRFKAVKEAVRQEIIT
jgi:DNA-binding CsgD family transcriptional regulator